MIGYNTLETAANALHLDILGAFHPAKDDPDLAGFETLVLLGPLEPAFWTYFKTQKEYRDGTPNPVDRWSSRVVSALAAALGGHPFFPFSGPPYMPFYQWALRTERCHSSPVNLLVHDRAGLFVSFRGALALRHRIRLPDAPASPCKTCTSHACLAACPVDAFASGSYDVAACRNVIRDDGPAHCLTRGCAVRRACPSSRGYGRLEKQSSYHMRVFLENDP
jgi:hypothetical protein